MTDLNEQIRRHYRQQSLPTHRINQLLAQQPQPPRRTLLTNALAWPRRLAVAMLLLTSTTVAVYYAGVRPAQDLTLAVTREVALNHRKALNLEFVTADYVNLNAAMNKLDFSLRVPDRLSDGRLRLQGARYCSIQGQIAAQLTFQDGDNKRYTLYQTTMSDTLQPLSSGERHLNDIMVERWREGTYFYALAYQHPSLRGGD